jgi:hypothetical protein
MLFIMNANFLNIIICPYYMFIAADTCPFCHSAGHGLCEISAGLCELWTVNAHLQLTYFLLLHLLPPFH